MISLEKLSHVTVIITSIGIVATLVSNHYQRASPPPGANANQSESVKNQKLPLPPLAAQTEAVALVMLSTSCRFCEESTDFYRRLQKSKDDSAGKFQVVTFFREPIAEAQAKLESWHFKPSFIYANGFKYLENKVAGTPTVLATDSGGLVHEVWIGKLNKDREKNVFEALSKLCKTCKPDLFSN